MNTWPTTPEPLRSMNDFTPEEEDRIDKSYRASGDCVCEQCGKVYYDHPAWRPSAKTNDGVPWLNELCNRDLVKL